MGLLWTESFDWCNSPSDLDQKYNLRDVPATGTFNTAQSRRGDQCLKLQEFDNLRAVLPETVKELTMGFAANFDSLPSYYASVEFLTFQYGGAEEFHIELTSNGAIDVYEDTYLRASGANLISACTWHYIEISVYDDTTSGSVEIRVDGAKAGSATGVKMGDNGKISSFEFDPTTGFPDFLLDDIYVTGSSTPNRGFLGSVYVQALFPNADGASTSWAASPTGSNYLNLDEVGPDGLATYVSSSNVGDQDSYGIEDISSSAASVFGVGVWVSAQKETAASRGFGIISAQGANFEIATCSMLTESFKLYSAMLDQDAASAAWTPAKVDSAEFGVKVTV